MNVKRSLRNFGKTLGTLALTTILSCNPNSPIPFIQPAIQSKYTVQKVQANENLEYRLLFDKDVNQRHFLSVINTNDGAVAIRPHPGLDENGWGSTWYPQAFFPRATLKHTIITPEAFTVKPEGINVNLEGLVSKGTNDSAGNWKLAMQFQFDPSAKKITGTGTYDIFLPTPPTEDLNVYKIATNFLYKVPLLNGALGNTGDMKSVNYNSKNWDFLTNPEFFPTDLFSTSTVDVKGNHNIVSTPAQGYAPIEPAFKPNIKVSLNSSDNVLSFGAIYDLAHATEFFSDNIGITPWIKANSIEKKEFHFTTDFESTALEEDGTDPDIVNTKPPEIQQTEFTLSFRGDSLNIPIINNFSEYHTLHAARITQLPEHTTFSSPDCFYGLPKGCETIDNLYTNKGRLFLETSKTKEDYLGPDYAKIKVTNGISTIEASIKMLFIDDYYGGPGNLTLPQELLDQSDKFSAEIVMHYFDFDNYPIDLNQYPLEKIKISPHNFTQRPRPAIGGRVLFVEPSDNYQFSGGTRSINELFSHHHPEVGELFGVRYVTEGAGDPWGQIHDTHFGFVSNNKIVVQKHTYISDDIDLVDINTNNKISLNKNRSDSNQAITDITNTIRYDPVNNIGILNVYLPSLGHRTWIKLNPDSGEITERDIFGNDGKNISDVIFASDGKAIGIMNNGNLEYDNNQNIIEILPERGGILQIATEKEIRQLIFPEVIPKQNPWDPEPNISGELMYNAQDKKIIIPYEGYRNMSLVSYDTISGNFSLLASDIPGDYFDMYNRTMYIANNDHIIRLQFKPPQ